MEYTSSDIEAVTMSDILGLASWNRPRSSEELQSFINSHHTNLFDSDEIE